MANDRTVDRGEAQLQFLPNQNRRPPPQTWLQTNEIADILRKHGGKTAEELKAEGN